MQSHATTCGTTPAPAAPSPLPRLQPIYARPEQAIQIVPISRRTLSDWQKRKIVPWYKVRRCVLFKISDLEAALDRYRVAPVGEPRPRKAAEMGTITIQPSKRKRRAGRTTPETVQ
jgi:hypothetical protein